MMLFCVCFLKWSQDLPITAPPLWPALPVSFVVDGSPRGLPAPPRQLYEAQQASGSSGSSAELRFLTPRNSLDSFSEFSSVNFSFSYW